MLAACAARGPSPATATFSALPASAFSDCGILIAVPPPPPLPRTIATVLRYTERLRHVAYALQHQVLECEAKRHVLADSISQMAYARTNP